jgi:hypothetical protein
MDIVYMRTFNFVGLSENCSKIVKWCTSTFWVLLKLCTYLGQKCLGQAEKNKKTIPTTILKKKPS